MKKLYFVLVAAFIANLTYSQGDLENQFYIRFGPSVPSWKYFGSDGKKDFQDAFDDDIKRGGAIFEMGSIFMLNGLKLADGMRIGINVDYLSLNFNRFKSKDAQSKMTTFFWGVKFGPSFSYSPVEKVVFDTYIKFNPVFLSTYFYAPYKADEDWDKEWAIGFFGPKLSVGLNARFSVFMIGVEYNPGLVKYNKYSDEEEELSDDYMGNIMDDDYDPDKEYSKVPCINITMGFSF